jgi:hypothetical protein
MVYRRSIVEGFRETPADKHRTVCNKVLEIQQNPSTRSHAGSCFERQSDDHPAGRPALRQVTAFPSALPNRKAYRYFSQKGRPPEGGLCIRKFRFDQAVMRFSADGTSARRYPQSQGSSFPGGRPWNRSNCRYNQRRRSLSSGSFDRSA